MKKQTLTEYIANDIVDTENSENWGKVDLGEVILTAMQDANMPFEMDDREYFALKGVLDNFVKSALDIEEAVEKEVKERADNYREYIEARDGYLKG